MKCFKTLRTPYYYCTHKDGRVCYLDGFHTPRRLSTSDHCPIPPLVTIIPYAARANRPRVFVFNCFHPSLLFDLPNFVFLQRSFSSPPPPLQFPISPRPNHSWSILSDRMSAALNLSHVRSSFYPLLLLLHSVNPSKRVLISLFSGCRPPDTPNRVYTPDLPFSRV